jgi:hypothetical protein
MITAAQITRLLLITSSASELGQPACVCAHYEYVYNIVIEAFSCQICLQQARLGREKTFRSGVVWLSAKAAELRSMREPGMPNALYRGAKIPPGAALESLAACGMKKGSCYQAARQHPGAAPSDGAGAGWLQLGLSAAPESHQCAA